MKNMRAFHVCLATGLVATLAACGGGGGSPGTPTGGSISGGGGGSGGGGSGGSGGGTAVTDKYIGTWVRCLDTGSGTSERETLGLNKTGDTTMVFNDVQVAFNNATCTGTGSSQATTNGTVLFTGTKTINGEAVDEVNITPTNGPMQKDVLVVRTDRKLYEGVTDKTAVLDANGYPSTIDPNGFAPQ